MPKRICYHRPNHLGPATAEYRRTADRRAANAFYSSTRWRKLRASYIAEHPLCEECWAKGLTVVAIDVHHKRERRDIPELAFDWDNLQALCKQCHNAKRTPGGE